jgi:hypothetical protein
MGSPTFGRMTMSQREYILEQLLAGRKITRLDIFNEIWCMTLNSRIPEIKNLGYDVKSKFVTRTNGMGVKKTFKQYWLRQDPQRELF